jgi:hypothetical protein
LENTRTESQLRLMDLIEQVKARFLFLNKDIEKILQVGKNSISTWKGDSPKRWVNSVKAPEYVKILEDYLINPIPIKSERKNKGSRKNKKETQVNKELNNNIQIEPEIKPESENKIETTPNEISIKENKVETTLEKLVSKKHLLLELIQIKEKQIDKMKSEINGIDNAIEALSETI